MVRDWKVRVRRRKRRMLVLMGVAGSGKHRSRVIMDGVAMEFSMDRDMRMLKSIVPVSRLMLRG